MKLNSHWFALHSVDSYQNEGKKIVFRWDVSQSDRTLWFCMDRDRVDVDRIWSGVFIDLFVVAASFNKSFEQLDTAAITLSGAHRMRIDKKKYYVPLMSINSLSVSWMHSQFLWHWRRACGPCRHADTMTKGTDRNCRFALVRSSGGSSSAWNAHRPSMFVHGLKRKKCDVECDIFCGAQQTARLCIVHAKYPWCTFAQPIFTFSVLFPSVREKMCGQRWSQNGEAEHKHSPTDIDTFNKLIKINRKQ